MQRCNKECKDCKTLMIDVMKNKVRCNDCAVKVNKANARARIRRLPKGVVAKKKFIPESLYTKITGKRRDSSCDASAFF